MTRLRVAVRWHVFYRLSQAFFWLSDQARHFERAGIQLMKWAR